MIRADPEKFDLIPFQDSFYELGDNLQDFVKKCDCIVHLAGVNRDDSPDYIFKKNIQLSTELMAALEKTRSKPHILFASSAQELKDNPYGRAKKKARELWINWAQKNKVPFSGLIIPNVFGPFGKPFYNSVVATFCHQLIQNQHPTVNIDADLELIYVYDLADKIIDLILRKQSNPAEWITQAQSMKVSFLLKRLMFFKKSYIENSIIPNLKHPLEVCLFNTLRSFVEVNDKPVFLKPNKDDRGSLVEIVKELTGGQVFFSTTHPGVTRGNHWHKNKIERFSVISGEAEIKFRKLGSTEITTIPCSGQIPSYVDIPVCYTHNITNTGSSELLTLFWTNELYNPDHPDTYFEPV